jgi:predicted Zn-dependent peptidase
MDIFIKSNNTLGFVGIGYKLGSAYEYEGLFGVSHLLEHLGCKPFESLLPKIKRLSINDNAYTSDNKLVFWFSGRERTLLDVVPEVAERILTQSPVWDEAGFDNEKETVLQEYLDTFNSQESGFYENIMRRYYGHFGPIGYYDDIKNFSYEQSKKMAKDIFSKPEFLSQVGSERILKLDLTPSGRSPKSLVFKESGYGVPEETVAKSDKTVVGLLGNRTVDISNAPLVNFIHACLNDGLESPLYTEIRENRGLSYFSIADMNVVGNSFISMFMATTSVERETELMDVYNDFFRGDLTRHISRERFEDCKEFFMGKKEIANILPHQAAGPASLKDFDKYEGLETLTYEKVLDGLNEFFTREQFIMASH